MKQCQIILDKFDLKGIYTEASHPHVSSNVDADPIVPFLACKVVVPNKHNLHPSLPFFSLIPARKRRSLVDLSLYCHFSFTSVSCFLVNWPKIAWARPFLVEAPSPVRETVVPPLYSSLCQGLKQLGCFEALTQWHIHWRFSRFSIFPGFSKTSN